MDEVEALICIAVIALASGGSLFAYLIFVQIPNDDRILNQTKTMINNSSCGDIGKYLIIHSTNYTWTQQSQKIYQYAQAKYLVCTHSLSGAIS